MAAGFHVKSIDWQENGAGHTPVGLFFWSYKTDGGEILERHDGAMTTKSFHASRKFARAFAFQKYSEQVLAALVVEES